MLRKLLEIQKMNSKVEHNYTKDELETKIKANYGLIVSQALSFNPRDKDQLDEYVQVGSMAMMRAFKNFDESKNTQFSTFACNCISNAIKNYIKKNSKSAEQISGQVAYSASPSFEEILPDSLSGLERQIINLKLSNLSIKEIADKLGFSVVKVRNILYKTYNKIREANEEDTSGK